MSKKDDNLIDDYSNQPLEQQQREETLAKEGDGSKVDVANHEKLYKKHYDTNKPHAERPKFLSGRTIGDGVHVIKVRDNTGVRHALLIEDDDGSTVLE